MAMTFEHAAAEPAQTAPLAIAILGAATLIGAWIFQYGFGIQPCPLCLEQRYAYYVVIPLACLLALGVSFGASRKVVVAGLVVIAGFMLWNAGLGAYHSGVEWGWWQGPQDCSGPITDLGRRRRAAEENRNASGSSAATKCSGGSSASRSPVTMC